MNKEKKVVDKNPSLWWTRWWHSSTSLWSAAISSLLFPLAIYLLAWRLLSPASLRYWIQHWHLPLGIREEVFFILSGTRKSHFYALTFMSVIPWKHTSRVVVPERRKTRIVLVARHSKANSRSLYFDHVHDAHWLLWEAADRWPSSADRAVCRLPLNILFCFPCSRGFISLQSHTCFPVHSTGDKTKKQKNKKSLPLEREGHWELSPHIFIKSWIPLFSALSKSRPRELPSCTHTLQAALSSLSRWFYVTPCIVIR